MNTTEPAVRLDESDENEWFDVCRSFRPDLTRDDFNVMWAEFQEMKRKYAARTLH